MGEGRVQLMGRFGTPTDLNTQKKNIKRWVSNDNPAFKSLCALLRIN